jgi:3-oxoadipate enol-lactonase
VTEQFVELADRGVTLCVERGGEGLPLLVLNGTNSDLRNHPNATRWPIAKHFDVLVYDHRGLGRSVQHDPDYQPTMADFAADALALCDSLGIQEFAAIGISFGGMVAQELATIAGTRLTKLVLCCTSSGGEGGSSYPLHELFAKGETMDGIFGLWDIRISSNEEVADQHHLFLGGRDRPQAESPTPGLLKQLQARSHHDMSHRLQLILADTLVAHGMYDGIAVPENSERLAERIKDATIAPFIGGHMFLWQDRTAWPAIIDFLNAP